MKIRRGNELGGGVVVIVPGAGVGMGIEEWEKTEEDGMTGREEVFGKGESTSGEEGESS